MIERPGFDRGSTLCRSDIPKRRCAIFWGASRCHIRPPGGMPPGCHIRPPGGMPPGCHIQPPGGPGCHIRPPGGMPPGCHIQPPQGDAWESLPGVPTMPFQLVSSRPLPPEYLPAVGSFLHSGRKVRAGRTGPAQHLPGRCCNSTED
eukprot:gene19067-biopygen17465